ncbi:MAG TPA: M20 family metallopeptidase [Solirubrobacteraceae bacterium]|nr:M20 family metallopeptidase [Solirubrobacteraceae bacterium]
MSAVDLALDLVRLDTVNPPGREQAAADLLAGRLEAAGLSVARHEHAPGRPSLIARWPGAEERPALCLTGHLDTVPLGGAPWSAEPFGELRDGRLYGRGSSDMKGGVAAIVVAAERVAALGQGAAGLELALCAGEETGCEGALHLAGSGALGRAGAVLVAEPTGGVPHVAHKGVLWVRASTEGRTAHGSAPHLGINAIYPLARAVAAFAELRLEAPPHAVLGEPTLNVGTISGGVGTNVVPDRASAGIDVRTVPGLESEAVLELLREAAGPDVAIEPVIDLAPVVTDPGDPWMQEVFEVAGDSAGGLAYFTDAAALTPAYGGVPTVIWGPGEAAQAHQTDEWAEAAKIDAAADAFTEVARRWCGL